MGLKIYKEVDYTSGNVNNYRKNQLKSHSFKMISQWRGLGVRDKTHNGEFYVYETDFNDPFLWMQWLGKKSSTRLQARKAFLGTQTQFWATLLG